MSLGRHFSMTYSETRLSTNDNFDDSTNAIPISGLKTTQSLPDRFMRRLSILARADIKMNENEKHHSITVILNCQPTSSSHEEKLPQFLCSMTESLRLISIREAGLREEKECTKLWDAVLIYSYNHVSHFIKSLYRSFDDNREIMADLVTKMLRVNCVDERGSALDDELASSLLSFYHNVMGYNDAMTELTSLVQTAATILQTIHPLEDRLKYLLEKSRFARELYRLIYTLGIPMRSYDTFVRAAKTSRLFEQVTFCLQHSDESTPSLNTTSSTIRLTSTPKETSKQENMAPNLSVKNTHMPMSLAVSHSNWFDVAWPYLSTEDQSGGLTQLDQWKQNAAQLVGTIVNGKILPEEANAWYVFGFVTTKSEDEERRLAGLYAVLLQESPDRTSIFRELTEAAQTTSLVNLFDIKGYSHFRNLSTHLEAFLKTPPEKRSTAWRLKQYVQTDDGVEPPGCLRRDYGFKFCKQLEEAEQLKVIYKTMLCKLGPQKLHIACKLGRLFDIAAQGGFVSPRHKRLMQNDYPSPFLGFDDDRGLDAYRGRLWKKDRRLYGMSCPWRDMMAGDE